MPWGTAPAPARRTVAASPPGDKVMYCEFFGLKTAPFNNTPDPRFFYNTPDHEEALASLIYAVEQRKGFVLVTGEVGSGKTLLSRLLLNRFDDSIQSAVLTHTRLTGREFLLAICREFELEVERDATAAELTNCLEEFLLKQYARDRLAVVILDEAQSLPVDSLEELRMLGNLEADDAKLLQVVILGQPELQDAFRSPALKQTYQRIFRTFHLGGLDRDLTAGYIARRLAIAGLAEGRQIFDPDAVDAIFQHSGGIPRMINQICDNALLAAYSDSRKRISARIIHDVVKQMMSLGETGRGEAVSGAKSPVPPSIDSGVGEGIPAGRTPPTGSSRGREDAGLLKHMAERLAAFEEELRAVKQDRPSPITLSLDETLDIEGVQQMRRDAEALLREVRKTSQDAERHIQDVLEKTRRSAQSAQVRARAEAKAAEKHNTTVQEQIREKLEGIREIADGQEARITQVVSQGKSEVEAIAELRRQASDLFEQITNSQKESDRRFHEAITEAAESRRDMEVRLEKAIADSCAVSDRLESRAGTFLEDARTHTATIQNQLETLISEVRARGDAAQARTTELLAQQRTDVDAARRRIDEFAGRMDSHSARVDRESREILDCLKDEAKGIVEQIHQVRDRSQSRAEAVSVRMEEVLGEMESRIQSSHDKISDLVSNAETEMRTACVSLQSAREQILSEAEDSRWQATEHLEETRSLLSDTRDQCGTLLGDLREQIDEQTEKAETIWRASAERGSKTLSELNEKLLEARKLTDHSRSELESLVRSATGELASARSALESSLGDQKAQIAQLSEDAGAIKLDFQERFDEARAALDARITGMESETSERIERAESEASDKVRKIKAEIEAQCDESVGLVSNALQQLGERVAQAETGAKGRIDLLTAELAAIIRQHSERAAARVCEIATQADARMNEAHSEASKKVQALQADLTAASEAADRIRSDLAQALDAMQRDAAHCRGRFEKEAEQFERKLIQLIERNRVALQEA
ncbi:MAG: AAA family ATPase, partial [Phycisphaerae bacterium]